MDSNRMGIRGIGRRGKENNSRNREFENWIEKHVKDFRREKISREDCVYSVYGNKILFIRKNV